MFAFSQIFPPFGDFGPLSELLKMKVQAASDGSLVNLSGYEQLLELAVSVARQPLHLLSLIFQFSSSEHLLCYSVRSYLYYIMSTFIIKEGQTFRRMRGVRKIGTAMALR